jgi:hypothetical protein
LGFAAELNYRTGLQPLRLVEDFPITVSKKGATNLNISLHGPAIHRQRLPGALGMPGVKTASFPTPSILMVLCPIALEFYSRQLEISRHRSDQAFSPVGDRSSAAQRSHIDLAPPSEARP